MSNDIFLQNEVERLSAEIGMSPPEYIQCCQKVAHSFMQQLPELIENLNAPSSVEEKNEQLRQKISMNARRTRGSF